MWITRRSPSQEGGDGNHFDPLPPQLDKDIGCLINTLATRLGLSIPHINTFSGKATPGKTEVSFEQSYHEGQCVKDHCPESVVWESIVRLLKGEAADMSDAWVLPLAWSI